MKLPNPAFLLILAACTAGEKSNTETVSSAMDNTATTPVQSTTPHPASQEPTLHAGTSFFIEIPESTSPNGVTAAVEASFMEYYEAHRDTSNRLDQHEISAVDLFSYEALTDRLSCTSGYFVTIHERTPSECFPDNHNFYYYFIYGDGPRYEVTSDPITVEGSSEDIDITVELSFDYSPNETCPFLAITKNTSIFVAGLNGKQELTLYRWSTEEHAFRMVFSAELSIDRRGGEGFILEDWTFNFVGDKNVQDIELSAGDTLSHHFRWTRGIYETID